MQLETAQVVLMHVGVPFATVQVVPHVPQALTLFVVAVSQPLATFPSQLPKPEEQAIEHVPDVQEGEPLTALHAAAHAPQFDTLVPVFVSQPLLTFASQLA